MSSDATERRRPKAQTYSVDEVTAVLGTGRSTVYELIRGASSRSGFFVA